MKLAEPQRTGMAAGAPGGIGSARMAGAETAFPGHASASAGPDADGAAASEGTVANGGAWLSADELLAGAALGFDVAVPAALVGAGRIGAAGKVRLRPLTVRDLQLVSRAARDNDALVGALMVHAAVVEPALSLGQVNAMPAGLMEFLLGEVNRVSGLAIEPASLEAAAEAPIARAAHLLARRFGWTPEQIGALTLGQILLHLQLLREKGNADD